MEKRIRKLARNLSKIKYHLPFAFFFFVIIDIVFFQLNPSVYFFFHLFWLVIFCLVWGLESRFLFAGSLVFLILCPFFIWLKRVGWAEDLAIGCFLFLVTGFIQRLMERKFKFLIKVDFDKFWEKLGNEIRMIQRMDLVERLNFLVRKSKGVWLGVSRTARIWLFILLVELIALILAVAIEEIFYYRYFFGESYLKQLAKYLFPQAKQMFLAILVSCLAITIIRAKIWLKRTLLIILLIYMASIERGTFARARERFELKPYILKIVPDIASNWMEVKIMGHNFDNLPFSGKVLLGGKEQKIKVWNDKTVVIEIDPIRSESGNLVLTRQHPDKGLLKSNEISFTHYDSRRATPEEKKRFWEMIKLISK
ncbi:MAG TPA: IPT/TIG domain-containing protein [Patescibacteria group bacterium]|nr:IPT/TIG domain-containing protein [Patescibacteria group bacterium]